MSETGLLRNALAWAHFRLRGGGRNALLFGVGYFVVVGMLVLAGIRVDPEDTQDILYGWMVALLALQIAILLLYGGGAVRTAVRKDITTGMIASHRLMPVSGTEAVAGYILGASPQPLAVATANFLLGILVAGPARLNPADWVWANALLLLFAVCAWVVVACASLISPKSAGAVLIAIVLISISGGFVLTLVPAITVVCSPLVGSTVFGIVLKGAAWSQELHVSILCQLLVTILLFVAAARKYRRDDVLALGPVLGMSLAAAFVAISIVGINNWSALQPLIWGWTGDVRQLQVLGSMTVGLMVALLPVSAAAWLQEDYRRRRLLHDPALGHRPLNSILLVCILAVMITAIPAACMAGSRTFVLAVGKGVPPAGELTPMRIAATFICMLTTLAPMAYLLRLVYRTRAAAGMLTALWIGLAWIGPWLIASAVLVASGIEEAARVPEAWEKGEFIAGFSPIGTLISIWTSEDSPYLAGLVFQIVLSGAMAVLYHTRRADQRKLRVPVPAGQ